MVTGLLVVRLTLVKCHRRLFTLGQTSNTSLALKKADVFKINPHEDAGLMLASNKYIIYYNDRTTAILILHNAPPCSIKPMTHPIWSMTHNAIDWLYYARLL